MNDDQPVPNPLLRRSATNTAFVLTLGHSHISVLDIIAHDERSRPSHWVGPAHGLIRRGLVEHRCSPNWRGRGNEGGRTSDFYRLTRAGWLMHDLLAEAGMVSPVADKALRKLVA